MNERAHRHRGAAVLVAVMLGVGAAVFFVNRAAPTSPSPQQADPAGSDDCGACHRQTLSLPSGTTFDVRGVYPWASGMPELRSGGVVPLMAESIELDAARAAEIETRTCTDCHAAHGQPDFGVDREDRINNMGLWVTAEPSPPNVLRIGVKVRNAASGHRAPAGGVAPAYVVTVNARQLRRDLSLRTGPTLPPQLRNAHRTAGAVFARDFRDPQGRPTADPARIANLEADTRLQSGRFQGSQFVFDRIDDSVAQMEVVLWYLPDVTTWEGAVAIRRARKPERAQP